MNSTDYAEYNPEGTTIRKPITVLRQLGLDTADKYHWLIDYTETCLSFGCPHEDENQSIYYNNPGYWLSTSDGGNSRGYRIDRTGRISETNVWDERKFGVRPVIKI